MNLHYVLYSAYAIFCILPMQLYAYDSEMLVYDVAHHTILGSYQRIGTNNGHESGIVKMVDKTTINVIEKAEQSGQGLIGYIKYKSTIRESGNSSKRSYLYQADLPENKVETDLPKKKHNHLIP